MLISNTELERDIEKLELYMEMKEIRDIEVYKIATKKQYDNNQYKKMANTYIGKMVELPASKKYNKDEYFIERITDIPRAIQQRLAGSNSSSWSNMIYLFNTYSNQEIEPITTLDIMKSLGKNTAKIQKIVNDIVEKYGTD